MTDTRADLEVTHRDPRVARVGDVVSFLPGGDLPRQTYELVTAFESESNGHTFGIYMYEETENRAETGFWVEGPYPRLLDLTHCAETCDDFMIQRTRQGQIDYAAEFHDKLAREAAEMIRRYVDYARRGWDDQKAELYARLDPAERALADETRIATTNCTPGIIQFGDEDFGFTMHCTNYYTGTRQRPEGLVDLEMRIEVAVGDGHTILDVPLKAHQCVEAAATLLRLYESDDWPHKSTVVAKPVLP